MSSLKIIAVPHPSLKTKSSLVEKIDDNVITQLDDMFETMYSARGIGLAANQVDLLNRVLVMDLGRDENDPQPIGMINPEIVWKSEDLSVITEGCLSVPEQFFPIDRPDTVRVKFIDRNREEQIMEFSGLASHCVQHEIDHLDGVLFIDYLSRLKRSMAVRKVEKIMKTRIL